MSKLKSQKVEEVDICNVPSIDSKLDLKTHIIECPQCKEKIVLEATR